MIPQCSVQWCLRRYSLVPLLRSGDLQRQTCCSGRGNELCPRAAFLAQLKFRLIGPTEAPAKSIRSERSGRPSSIGTAEQAPPFLVRAASRAILPVLWRTPKLRGCDVVRIKIGDLVIGGQIRARAIVVQQKTGRPVQFELLTDARASLLAWLERRGGTLADYVFPSRVDRADHISTRQYARLVDEWVSGVGLRREEYGTHSLRRTKASIIYKATGNLRAVQILLGHTKIENTVRYLGVDVEDALMLAESTEI